MTISQSLNLKDYTITPATGTQIDELTRSWAEVWHHGLDFETLCKYWKRADESEWATNGACIVWVLVRRDNMLGTVYAGCKSFRRSALVKLKGSLPGMGKVEKGWTYNIDWVVTPKKYRRRGYATHMLSLLHHLIALTPPKFPVTLWGLPPILSPQMRKSLPRAIASTLWSEVGPNFYAKCTQAQVKPGWIVDWTQQYELQIPLLPPARVNNEDTDSDTDWEDSDQESIDLSDLVTHRISEDTEPSRVSLKDQIGGPVSPPHLNQVKMAFPAKQRKVNHASPVRVTSSLLPNRNSNLFVGQRSTTRSLETYTTEWIYEAHLPDIALHLRSAAVALLEASDTTNATRVVTDPQGPGVLTAVIMLGRWLHEIKMYQDRAISGLEDVEVRSALPVGVLIKSISPTSSTATSTASFVGSAAVDLSSKDDALVLFAVTNELISPNSLFITLTHNLRGYHLKVLLCALDIAGAMMGKKDVIMWSGWDPDVYYHDDDDDQYEELMEAWSGRGQYRLQDRSGNIRIRGEAEGCLLATAWYGHDQGIVDDGQMWLWA